MKILVTGGAGFIGSNFIYYILNKHPEDEIICLDKLTYAGNINNLKYALNNSNFKFIKGDIVDKNLVDQIFKNENFDVVINFAAESHVDNSIKNPEIFLVTNILGTQNLLNACKKYGVKRFHQVSTDEVYGDLPLDRPDLLFTENNPIKASSPYSASKASADLLVLAYHRTFGLPITISRCSNNYGPYQFPEKLIPLMIYNATHDKKLPVYGEGLNIRDWLFVDDHCEAIDLIVRNGRIGEVYNIGGNNERTNIFIVKEILSQLGKDDTLIEYVEDRKGHDLRYGIDASKIKDELGWEPTVNFEEGLNNTIKWYLDNSDWLENIKNSNYQKDNEEMKGWE